MPNPTHLLEFYTLDGATGEAATGMRSILENLFGTYTPVMTNVYDDAGNLVGQAVASGMAGVDWTYVGGVLLFTLVLFSVFKLLGVFLKR